MAVVAVASDRALSYLPWIIDGAAFDSPMLGVLALDLCGAV